ncbi:chemotaxis response regulator protein-glutamate methylesterase [Sediminicoccus sp. KRV36]|uniref:protein-glutamate methylesterase/protein-glutamine glutaminase n=1 Tax=Sediminicoccus sp. KRV36 TaxID=3133721 RepID=UPI00200C90DF|nr:chemotaxis response regulator protein-glutamate methylesterase [Sediminicoccus rosea]UPY37250.1 chemotaxis response regulator protein-glutamate methylesterase [Sediminicoccus rosea]
MSTSAPAKLRVMLCDDSSTVRAALARVLETDPAIAVVARVGDGAQALAALDGAPSAERAQVVLLDLEMPVMDGMTALPLILRREPRPIVIVASALTQRGASATMEALRAGASDYIPKPGAAGGGLNDPNFRADLLAKVKGWARLRQPTARVAASPPRPARRGEPPRIICIGSSTGGPQALAALVRRLPRLITLPVVIVQHMPAGFTAMLAKHLDALGGPPVSEARQGEVLEAGRIYLAPGDHHLLAKAEGARTVLHLSDAPPENFCRPAVDPTLRSLIAIYGRAVQAVILTGMGHDGLMGCRALAQAGGAIWAQDEASSVVWGMPGAVARAGLAQEQGTPESLGDALAHLCGRRP